MVALGDASFAVIRAAAVAVEGTSRRRSLALGAMNALFLARRGSAATARRRGDPSVFDHLLGRPLRVDWDAEGYEGVVSSTIKKY